MPRPAGTRHPYPFETLRHWYVSPFGGRSEELAPGQVGVNAAALAENTEIDAARDRVSVGVLGETREPRPLLLREQFEVVPLDETRPGSLALSPEGEVVLPDGEWDFVRRPYLQPSVGQALVLTKPPGRLAAEPAALGEILARELRRRRGS
jgi:hypothetical protein